MKKNQMHSLLRKELEGILHKALKMMDKIKAHLNQKNLVLRCNLVVRMTQILSR